MNNLSQGVPHSLPGGPSVALLPKDMWVQLIMRRRIRTPRDGGLDDSDEEEEGNAVLHDKANNWQRLTGTSLDLAQPSLSLDHPHCSLLVKKMLESRPKDALVKLVKLVNLVKLVKLVKLVNLVKLVKLVKPWRLY